MVPGYTSDSLLPVRDCAHAQELLGWWIIPIGLIFGIAIIVATTALLRSMLRFALPTLAARFRRVDIAAELRRQIEHTHRS
jgi:hypothetical protein